MPTTLDLNLLSKTDGKCLQTIIRYFFDHNLIDSSFENIKESFYKKEYYVEVDYGEGSDIIILSKYEAGTKSRKVSDFPMPLLKKSINLLVDRGYLITTDERGDPYFEICPDFAELAYELYSQNFEFFEEAKVNKRESEIPAADRFVSIDHNSIVVSEAKDALTELSEAIRGSNDLLPTAEDRIQVSEEINYLSDLISKPRAHITAVWDAAKNNQVLIWLSKQTGAAVVRQAASKVLENLHHLLQFLLSLK